MIQTALSTPSVFWRLVQLLKEIANDPIDFGEVERLITLDVTLSLQVTAHMCNLQAASATTICSFPCQALIFLGEQSYASLFHLWRLHPRKEDKPDSLYGLAVLRARECGTSLVEKMNVKVEPDKPLTGMFSLLDSGLTNRWSKCWTQCQLMKRLSKLWIQRKGVLGAILAMVIAYEQARWDEATRIRKLLKSKWSRAFAFDEATTWAQELVITVVEIVHFHITVPMETKLCEQSFLANSHAFIYGLLIEAIFTGFDYVFMPMR